MKEVLSDKNEFLWPPILFQFCKWLWISSRMKPPTNEGVVGLVKGLAKAIENSEIGSILIWEGDSFFSLFATTEQLIVSRVTKMTHWTTLRENILPFPGRGRLPCLCLFHFFSVATLQLGWVPEISLKRNFHVSEIFILENIFIALIWKGGAW